MNVSILLILTYAENNRDGGADHRKIDAEIKQYGCRQFPGTEQRQIHLGKNLKQKRFTEEKRTRSGQDSNENTECSDPFEIKRDDLSNGSHIVCHREQDEGGRGDQTADKTSSRVVMPCKKNIYRVRQDDHHQDSRCCLQNCIGKLHLASLPD